jgi:predicted dehydrogenase
MPKVAVAGVGTWGRNIVRNLVELDSAQLSHCYDHDPAALQWVRDNYPQVETVANFDVILRQEDVDSVIVSTSAHTHFEFARRALAAEKHVLVEKPLTLSVAEAEKLVERAEKRGLVLMVGHLMKYHPAVQEMRRQLAKGILGDVCYMHSHRLGLGRVREVENVMWCLATHDIYIASYLMGAYPSRVQAVGESFLQRDKGIEDVVFLTLFFDSGVFANIHASWVDAEKVRKTKVIGTDKLMVLDELVPFSQLTLYDRGIVLGEEGTNGMFLPRHGEVHSIKVQACQPLRQECIHFIECTRNHQRPFTDGVEGLRVVRVLEAAQKALKRGGIVTV